MQTLIESGRIVELIVLILVVEAGVLLGIGRRRLALPGAMIASLLLNLAAGAFLLLGLRAILLNTGWQSAGALLGLAGMAHAGELWLRFKQPRDSDRFEP